jgi:hypothetical protein
MLDMVWRDQYFKISAHYSKAVILLSILIIVSVSMFVVWPRYSSIIFQEKMYESIHFEGVSKPGSNTNYNIDDALSSFYPGEAGEVFQDVRTDITDHVLIVSVPTSTPTHRLKTSKYINYDERYNISYPSSWRIATSSPDTLFLFDDGSFSVSRILHGAIPDLWEEVSEFSDDGKEEYIRTYSSFEDAEKMYYTFIMRDGESFVITTTIPEKINYEPYYEVIMSFTII